MIDILSQSPALLTLMTLLLGLVIGSFLNVVIYRLPIMMENEWKTEASEFLELPAPEFKRFNLMTPNSACPECSAEIKAWQNIPLISYAILGGKCARCKTRISPRYPLIELTTAILSAWAAWTFGWGIELAAILLFLWVTLAITFIDFDTQLIPDSLVYPLIWGGLLFHLISGTLPLETAVIGAMAGYLSLWSVYWAFKLITGKEGMGYGDFKLLAAFGAWFGWQALPMIILLSALVGAVVGLSLIAVLGRDRNIPIPFGPYLCGAAWVFLFWGDAIMTWYMGTL